mmetsp:Transcript_25384/g.53682  ORF Transcript_25384/g.53682 Transcript_25384/m.53682 type:complete len:430 (+) Transcript_25384:325-1614(+)
MPQKRNVFCACSEVCCMSSRRSLLSFSTTRRMHRSRLFAPPRIFMTSSTNLVASSSSNSCSFSSFVSAMAGKSSLSNPSLSLSSTRSDSEEALGEPSKDLSLSAFLGVAPSLSWRFALEPPSRAPAYSPRKPRHSAVTTSRSRSRERCAASRLCTCSFAMLVAGRSSRASTSAASRVGSAKSSEAQRKCNEDMRPVLKSFSVVREPMVIALAPLLLSPWLMKFPRSSAIRMTSRNMFERWMAPHAARMEDKDLTVLPNWARALRAMQRRRTLATHRLSKARGRTMSSTSRSRLRASRELCSRNFAASSWVGITSKICSRSSVLISVASHFKRFKIRVSLLVFTGRRFSTMAMFRARWSLSSLVPTLRSCALCRRPTDLRAPSEALLFSASNMRVSASVLMLLPDLGRVSSPNWSLKMVPSASTRSRGFQ